MQLPAHHRDPRGHSLGAGPGRDGRARQRPGRAHRVLHRDRGRLLARQRTPPRRRPAGDRGRRRAAAPRRGGRDHLRRRRRHPARAHAARRRPGDAAQLRQPAPQRRALPRRAAGLSGARRRRGAAGLGPRPHHLAQRDGGPHHAAPATRTARARARRHRLGRRRAGDGRKLHPVGDRGRLHRRPAGVGDRGRADGAVGSAL